MCSGVDDKITWRLLQRIREEKYSFICFGIRVVVLLWILKWTCTLNKEGMNTRIKYMFLIRDILWRSLRKNGPISSILLAYRLLDGTGGSIPWERASGIWFIGTSVGLKTVVNRKISASTEITARIFGHTARSMITILTELSYTLMKCKYQHKTVM